MTVIAIMLNKLINSLSQSSFSSKGKAVGSIPTMATKLINSVRKKLYKKTHVKVENRLVNWGEKN